MPRWVSTYKEQNIDFTEDGLAELEERLADATSRILNMTVSAFKGDDIMAAYRVEPLEEVIDGIQRDVEKSSY